MLKIVSTVQKGNVTTYMVEGTVELAMDSLWDYKGKSTVTVTEIRVERYTEEKIADWAKDKTTDDVCLVKVKHGAGWNIYTDSGFKKGISELLGFEVNFTEQGMQLNKHAHMAPRGAW